MTQSDLERLALAVIEAASTMKTDLNLPDECKMCYKYAYINGITDFVKVLREFYRCRKNETKILYHRRREAM